MFSVATYSASASYAVLPSVADALLVEGKDWDFARWLNAFPVGARHEPIQWVVPAQIEDELRTRPELQRQNYWFPRAVRHWAGRVFLGRSWEALQRVLAGASGSLRQAVFGDRFLVKDEGRHVAVLCADEVPDVARSLQTISVHNFLKSLDSLQSAEDCHYNWRRFREVQAFYRWAEKNRLALIFVANKYAMDLAVLERRLRPEGSSLQGFLGPAESLLDIITADTQTLDRLSLCHEHVASALEAAVFCVDPARLHFVPPYNTAMIGTFRSPLDGHGLGTGLGWQECPWGCDEVEMDFIEALKSSYILHNRISGERIEVPGLIVHLAREHHFFEGKGTYYRADLERLVRILEIQPCRGSYDVEPNQMPCKE